MARKTSRSFDKITSRDHLVAYGAAFLTKMLRNTDRCLVVLEEHGKLVGRGGEGVKPSEYEKDQSLGWPAIARVVEKAEPVLVTDSAKDPLFAGRRGPRSVLCVPVLDQRGKVVGFLYADNKIQEKVYNDLDVDLTRKFAQEFAVKLEEFPPPAAPAPPPPEPAVETAPAAEPVVEEPAQPPAPAPAATRPEPSVPPVPADPPPPERPAAPAPAAVVLEPPAHDVSRATTVALVLVALLLVAGLAWYFFGTGTGPAPVVGNATPADAARGFVARSLQRDFGGAYSLLSQGMRKNRAQRDFEAAMEAWLTPENEADLRSRKVVLVRSGPSSGTVYLEPAADGPLTWEWVVIKEAAGWRLDHLSGGPVF